jgi:hypothetical protein
MFSNQSCTRYRVLLLPVRCQIFACLCIKFTLGAAIHHPARDLLSLSLGCFRLSEIHSPLHSCSFLNMSIVYFQNGGWRGTEIWPLGLPWRPSPRPFPAPSVALRPIFATESQAEHRWVRNRDTWPLLLTLLLWVF